MDLESKIRQQWMIFEDKQPNAVATSVVLEYYPPSLCVGNIPILFDFGRFIIQYPLPPFSCAYYKATLFHPKLQSKMYN